MKSLLLNSIITLFIVLAAGYTLLYPHYAEAADVAATPDLMMPHNPDLLNDLSKLDVLPTEGCRIQPKGYITVYNRTGGVLMWGTTKLKSGEKKFFPKNHGDLVKLSKDYTYDFYGKNCTEKKTAIHLRMTGDKPNTLPVQIIEGAYEGLKVDDWVVRLYL